MMPTSDIDTIANADDLWRLVHLVQEIICKDGCIMVPTTGNRYAKLKELRKLADELDPENGRY
jgi:hypothetical protein